MSSQAHQTIAWFQPDATFSDPFGISATELKPYPEHTEIWHSHWLSASLASSMVVIKEMVSYLMLFGFSRINTGRNSVLGTKRRIIFR